VLVSVWVKQGGTGKVGGNPAGRGFAACLGGGKRVGYSRPHGMKGRPRDDGVGSTCLFQGFKAWGEENQERTERRGGGGREGCGSRQIGEVWGM